MTTPFPGLVSGDELKTIYNLRSKSVEEQTIKSANAEALALKLEAEKLEGWRPAKTNKQSIRLEKDKTVDIQLEDDVWSLLYRMEFKEINKDRNLRINGRQWDVMSKDDETVFFVECTHSEDKEKKDLKSLLDKVEANRDAIIQAVHKHYGKEPKLKIKFAIATRNKDWRKVDLERAKNNHIAIITGYDLRYFSDLTTLLKRGARYQFLGRYLSGERVDGLREELPATRGRAGNLTFYNFLISPHDLLRIAYISHKSKTSNDDLGTYQRMVKPARLKAIAEYIDNGGKFPTNIVINFKTKDTLNFDLKQSFGDTATGILHLPGQYGSAWIIDGQHRLYGYAHAKRNAEEDHSVISVLAYENMPVREEIKLFVDINTEQVRVTRNLVNEILASLDIEDPDPYKRLDALHALIALRMNEHSTSPINGRIATVSQGKDPRRRLTLTSITDGIAAVKLIGTVQKVSKNTYQFVPGSLADASGDSKLSIERAVSILSRFLTLFAEKLDAHWQLADGKGGFLCTNNGIRVLFILLGKILDFIESSERRRPNAMEPEDIIEAIEPYVQPVIDFFAHGSSNEIELFRKRGSSLASLDQNAQQMECIINDAIPSYTSEELRKYRDSRDVAGTHEAKNLIDEIELAIHTHIVQSLQEHYGVKNEAWWHDGIQTAIRNDCDKQYNGSDRSRDRWTFLNLQNYREIISSPKNWDIFKDHYNFIGKGRRSDQTKWIQEIDQAKMVTHNAQKGPLAKEQVEFVRCIRELVRAHIEGGEEVDGKTDYLAHETAAATAELEPAE